MEAIRIIKGFAKLLAEKRSEFTPEARENLTQLDRTLAALPNDEAFPVAEAILDWCENYPQIKEALKKLRVDIGEEEEFEEGDRRLQAMITENITLLRQTIQAANPPSPPDSETKP